MKNSRYLSYTSASVVFILVSYSIFLFATPDRINFLAREDGLYENIGAVLLLLSAIFFLVVFWKHRESLDLSSLKKRRNIFFLLLGLLFLFGFMEEISWGQRILDLNTPESLRAINRQNEINLHNLEIFQGYNKDGTKKPGLKSMAGTNKMLTLFWLSFCILVPLFYKYSGPVRKLLNRLRMPIVPLFIGGLFVFNYLIAMAIDHSFGIETRRLADSLVEIKETNISFLFALLGFWFYRDLVKGKVEGGNGQAEA